MKALAVTLILIGVLSYALGCIAVGYYLVRWRLGEDIRAIGSGTTGGFNVMRRLGVAGFLLTSGADFAKGAAAVILAQAAGLDAYGQLLALLAVIIGHNFPLQLGLRGGNGLAPLTGALLVYDVPLAGLLAAVFAASVLLVSLLRALKLPVQVYTPAKITVLCVPLAALVMQRPPLICAGLALVVLIIMTTIAGNFRLLAANATSEK